MFDDIFSPLDTMQERDMTAAVANNDGGPAADDLDGGR